MVGKYLRLHDNIMKVLKIWNTANTSTWYIKVATFLQVHCKLFVSFLFLSTFLSPGSGSTDPIESGSDTDPDPQHCLPTFLQATGIFTPWQISLRRYGTGTWRKDKACCRMIKGSLSVNITLVGVGLLHCFRFFVWTLGRYRSVSTIRIFWSYPLDLEFSKGI